MKKKILLKQDISSPKKIEIYINENKTPNGKQPDANPTRAGICGSAQDPLTIDEVKSPPEEIIQDDKLNCLDCGKLAQHTLRYTHKYQCPKHEHVKIIKHVNKPPSKPQLASKIEEQEQKPTYIRKPPVKRYDHINLFQSFYKFKYMYI